MRRGTEWIKRILGCMLSLALFAGGIPGPAAAEESAQSGGQAEAGSYAAYLEACAGKNGAGTITIPAAERYQTDAEVHVEADYEGQKGQSLYTPEGSSVTWSFDVETEGLYTLRLRYYPVEGKGVDIERTVLINGAVPYAEAENLLFPRIWSNALDHVETDVYGNDIRPSQKENPIWQEKRAADNKGYYEEALRFYLRAGNNTVTLRADNEPMLLHALTFEAPKSLRSYSEAADEYRDRAYAETSGKRVVIQGEDADYKSSAVLYPITDRTSPATEPYEASIVKLNSIGGTRWASNGQFLIWEFDVPQTGLYQIAVKARQNTATGVASYRRIYIDDEVPFAELDAVSFRYDTAWQNTVLGGDEPFLFYLEEGPHEIKMEVVLSRMGEVLQEVDDILAELNRIYRDILVITGSNPDLHRDYRLETLIPETIENIALQYERLTGVVRTMQDITGQKGGDSIGILKTAADLLKTMAEKPTKIAKKFSYFKTNIGSLGTWLSTYRQQPLEIDSITVYSADQELKKPEAGFFDMLVFHIRNFIDSFVKDYDAIGNRTMDHENGITVWISSGRDQTQTLKSIINDSFVPEYGIPVDLKLVTQGTLLSATIAGIGPDVALGVPMTDPVNFALRGALLDVSRFDDFETVRSWFNPELFVPYSLEGRIYALPETQSFSMLFYREDILAELGLEVPETWTDIIAMITVLNKKNMQFGLSNAIDVNTFYMLLLQNGGQVFTDDQTTTVLDSSASVEAFKKWANFYINYNVAKELDILNRFRVGEVPVAIADYSMYNSLQVSAPEIKGLWNFTSVPGTLLENGEVDHSTVLSSTASVLMSDSKNPDAAWNFLKWWVSADAQSRFGSEMESILGESARYPTANLEAFSRLPWSKSELTALETQLKSAKGIPQIPGSYFLQRHLTNAVRQVILHDKDAKDTLLDYVNVINQEIANKRDEFHMS